MKLLIIVNESPWQSTLALSACHFAQAALDAGVQITAIFFREEGVYNSLAGELSDVGTPDLATTWAEMASASEMRLLLCSSSRMRRISAVSTDRFEESGLTELMELILLSDRVVSF